MKRQAMEVSIKELREKADALEKEAKEISKDIGVPLHIDKKWSVSIINKTPECSDTWGFEK